MSAATCAGLLCNLDSVAPHRPMAAVAAAEDAAGVPRGSIQATAFAANLLPLAKTVQIVLHGGRVSTADEQ